MLEAEFMVAAGKMNMTPTAAMVDAAQRWIKWADQTAPRRALRAEVRKYEAGKCSTAPDPRDYGLPADILIPKL
ncbi:hypothetical protein [Acidisoma cladoniae]|uniref:hypothetical protein n=1 Tax=Acidisoma cladoniae TaxID=3040935 RepID=UPI00254AE4B8|nr:hypothetical protein [Acidisoma sp. PAMC 29798]